MSIVNSIILTVDTSALAQRAAGYRAYFACSTEAELPSANVLDNDTAYAADTGRRFTRISGSWVVNTAVHVRWGEILGTLTDQADLEASLDAKQATLVSATNIKTINGNSVLGSGDLTVSGSAAWGSITGTLSSQSDLQSALDAKLATNGNGSALTGLTKSQVGLANADNTSDANKPVSTATQSALDLKANLASPTFTGTVGGITAAMVGAPSGSGNSTGTNTGDNATNSQYSGLAASKQDTLVSGTNIKTVNGSTLLGSGNLTVSAADPSYAPGSFTVATETARMVIKRLQLTSTQRATVSGTARLRLSN